jgi:hypothetical protein
MPQRRAIARLMPPASSGSACPSPGGSGRPPAASRQLRPWQTSVRTPYKSRSPASDTSLAPVRLRIIRAMPLSAARGETAECVATRSRPAGGHSHVANGIAWRHLTLAINAIASVATAARRRKGGEGVLGFVRTVKPSIEAGPAR